MGERMGPLEWEAGWKVFGSNQGTIRRLEEKAAEEVGVSIGFLVILHSPPCILRLGFLKCYHYRSPT